MCALEWHMLHACSICCIACSRVQFKVLFWPSKPFMPWGQVIWANSLHLPIPWGPEERVCFGSSAKELHLVDPGDGPFLLWHLLCETSLPKWDCPHLCWQDFQKSLKSWLCQQACGSQRNGDLMSWFHCLWYLMLSPKPFNNNFYFLYLFSFF